MASNRFLMITIVAMLLPAIAMATEYIVGDYSGWTIGFDYQAWAKDKVFRVGDKLVFQYPQGVHNVFKVNGSAFQNCKIPPSSDQALTSGNDTIVLLTPGRKWYICGVGNHCSAGQKLAITVYSYGWAPAPAPSSPWGRLPSSPSVPTTPTTPTQPWVPAPAPAPSSPWSQVPTSSPPMPTEDWAPSPQPWSPAPAPSSPWSQVPSAPTTPTTPSDGPWAAAPSPYPWI